ncbi:MAG: PEP-CTERM sorting domain-containing protein [Alicycliphilus sp.]|nr:MAG: PEP-CTERM sorting domain-containing protein [Alicycliphilus sp.]
MICRDFLQRVRLIGGTGGSITNPGTVPEPSTLALLGIVGLGLVARRRMRA